MGILTKESKDIVDANADNYLTEECKAKFMNPLTNPRGRLDVLNTVKENGIISAYGVQTCQQHYIDKNLVVEGVIIRNFLPMTSARRVLKNMPGDKVAKLVPLTHVMAVPDELIVVLEAAVPTRTAEILLFER